MSETLSFYIAGFSLKSKWTNKNNRVYTTPTVATATKQVAVSGIPDGATIDSVILRCTCGSSLGGARVLSVNGKGLRSNRDNEIDFAATVTANGTYSFLFKFQDYGKDNMSDGSHYGSMSFSSIRLVITYTGAEPDPEPEPEPEPADLYDYPDSHNICFYAPDDEDFTTNGLGILTPSRCTITEEAGGQYELEMELPADGETWKLLECESIIKAPVPAMIIEAFEMAGAEYWKINSNQGNVAVKSKVPTVTRVSNAGSYSSWSASTPYTPGAKVSYGGNAWQYTGPNLVNYYADVGVTPSRFTSPPGSASYWKNITSTSTKTNDGKTLATLKRNEVFTKIADANNGWMRIKTGGGVTGYIEASRATFFSNAGAHVESREIRQQCFRVYRIEKDSDTRTVRINARHLSYDFAKTYLAKCESKAVTVPVAISLVEEAELEEDNRHIYTDISEDTVDLDCSWDNGISALLNPDAGIVAQLQAKLIRDNDDIFILKDEHTDRGFRLDYGNNLRSVDWSNDTSNMVTRVIPHCKDASDNDMLLPEMYVDSEKIEDYPIIYMETMSVNCKVGGKGTISGQEVSNLTAEQCYTIMREEAAKRFTVDHADEPEVDIDVDMLMLGSTVEYSHLAPLEVLFMYDTVHIRHPLLGLDIEAYMTGYEYDAILRRYNKIKLTNARRRLDTSVSGFDLRDNSIRFEKLSSTAIDRLRN